MTERNRAATNSFVFERMDALRLEVNDDNAHARGIYERAGYIAHPRRLMTLWLRG